MLRSQRDVVCRLYRLCRVGVQLNFGHQDDALLVVGVVFQDLREEMVRLAEIPLGKQGLSPFELFPELARQGLLKPLDDHLLRQRADELVLHLAVHEQLDGRNARDPEPASYGGILLGIELA